VGPFQGRPVLRNLLYRSVAATTLLCLNMGSAQADCVFDQGRLTCSGTTTGGLPVTDPPYGPSVIVDVFGQLSGGIAITDIDDSFVTNHGHIEGPITVSGGIDFTFIQAGTFGGVTVNAVVCPLKSGPP